MTEAENLREMVLDGLARAERSAVLAQSIAEEVAKLSGSAQSSEGVRVVVDHHGLVASVTLTDRAMDDGVDALRDAVLQTTHAANADLRAQAEILEAPLRAQAMPLDDTSILDAYDRLLDGGLDTTSGSEPR